MELGFNELSLNNLPQSSEIADKAMKDLIDILNDLKKGNNKKGISIRTTHSLSDTYIADDYHIKQWITKNKMLASIFLTATAQKPIVRDYPYYLFNKIECQGFAYAHENDLLAISYNPNNEWNETEYVIEMQLLDEQDGNFISEQVTVLHIGQKEHSNIHEEWVKRKIKISDANLLATIKNGKELWVQRNDVFSHLIFCDCVETQISDYSLKDPNLATSINKLLVLNAFLANKEDKTTDFSGLGLAISGESEATLNLYSKERTFLCSDGLERVFESHIKLANWRIHFYPVLNENKCWVGYVGKHLPTKKDN